MPEYTEHHHKAKDSGARSLGTIGTVIGGLALLGAGSRNNCNGGGGFLNGIFGGGCNDNCAPTAWEVQQRQDNINQAMQKGVFELALAQQKADYDLFILSQQGDMGLQRQIDQAKYDALKGNYDLYITLNEKIEAVKDAQSITAAQLPYAMALAKCESERYTDFATRDVIRGVPRINYSDLVTGIPSMPPVALKVSCPEGSCPPVASK